MEASPAATPRPSSGFGGSASRRWRRAMAASIAPSGGWTRSGRRNLKRQRAAGNRHPRWGYFSPLSPYRLLRFARQYRLRLIAIDSEIHSPAAVGVLAAVLGRVCAPLRRATGWRLGAA